MSADVSADAAPITAARKSRTRWALIVVGLLIVVAVGIIAGTLLWPKGSAQSSLATAAVERKTLRIVVSGTGTTVVNDSVTVNPEISGTVQKLYVSLGETVTAGDILYTISSSDVDTSLLKAKASLLQSKQAKTQASQSEQQAENQVYSAKTSKIQAQQSLDSLESKPATTPGVADQIVIAKRQVTSAKAGVTSAQTALDAAETGVSVAAANLASAQKSYDDALADTKATVVKAPITGVVTALPISVGSAVTAGTTSSSSTGSSGSSASGSSASAGGSTSSSSGSTSSSSGSAITISDMSSIKVQVSVSEVDIPSVARSQAASVTFDAIPGKTFAGKVGAISPNGTSSSGVVNYTVDVNLDSLDPSLRPNMTATADIVTQVASNVLVVPSSAVKSSSGTKYVLVVDPSGQTKQQTVTVGVSDDTYTEVKTGVIEGANVSTGASTASSSSSSTSSSKSGGGLMMGGPPSGGGAPPGGN
jgi:membrane fusion protein, macrolide-specific efflux system